MGGLNSGPGADGGGTADSDGTADSGGTAGSGGSAGRDGAEARSLWPPSRPPMPSSALPISLGTIQTLLASPWAICGSICMYW
jgi:hypothetical protein